MDYKTNIAVGYGKCHASFGEILQGRLTDENDFLVTLPIDMWSICNLTSIKRPGPRIINCEYFKSKTVAEMLLAKLGIDEGYEITISFSRNIPVGKGLSSSTADMLSTIRALQEIFGFLLREKTISEIFTEIEPHDGLMYKSCVIYNHRKGELIKELLYIPQYWIIALDFGGELNTIEYNSSISYPNKVNSIYDKLYYSLLECFKDKDDIGIAECATKSLETHISFNQNKLKLNVLRTYKRFNPIGLINTHSGTCIGFIYPKTFLLSEINDIAEKIQTFYSYNVFLTNTLRLLI